MSGNKALRNIEPESQKIIFAQRRKDAKSGEFVNGIS
jgi:hypothetical protein